MSKQLKEDIVCGIGCVVLMHIMAYAFLVSLADAL
jgi:hypothetical protein